MMSARHLPVLIAVFLATTGCDGDIPQHLRVADGDPVTGRILAAGFGCTACHHIPGVGMPTGVVGPSLDGFGRRAYLAGRVPNRPATLTAWLRDPPGIDPETAMPAIGLDEGAARNIAAYLYSLR